MTGVPGDARPPEDVIREALTEWAEYVESATEKEDVLAALDALQARLRVLETAAQNVIDERDMDEPRDMFEHRLDQLAAAAQGEAVRPHTPPATEFLNEGEEFVCAGQQQSGAPDGGAYR